jgi:hypothetical protein
MSSDGGLLVTASWPAGVSLRPVRSGRLAAAAIAGHACLAIVGPLRRSVTLETGQRPASHAGFCRAALDLLSSCLGKRDDHALVGRSSCHG